MTSVADLVEPLVTGDAAPPALRQAALRLAGEGAVRLDTFEPLRVTAAVDDAGVCRVELASTRDGLRGHCECDGDTDGHPCVHVLAAAVETWNRAPKRRR
jgi:hypothetical protein